MSAEVTFGVGREVFGAEACLRAKNLATNRREAKHQLYPDIKYRTLCRVDTHSISPINRDESIYHFPIF